MIAKSVIIAFIILELSNVLALYFAPGSKKANAVGVFSAWEKSKQDPEIHEFVKYLVYWVAGVKIIFLALLGLIIVYGDQNLQRLSLLALLFTTATFFWRLFPMIRKMDRLGQIEPKRYSLIVGGLIFSFIAIFALAAYWG